MAWESNYRGSLGFLRQARAQQATRGLVAGRGRLAVLRARLEQMMAVEHDGREAGHAFSDECARPAETLFFAEQQINRQVRGFNQAIGLKPS